MTNIEKKEALLAAIANITPHPGGMFRAQPQQPFAQRRNRDEDGIERVAAGEE